MNKTFILLGLLLIVTPIYSAGCPAFDGLLDPTCKTCRRIDNCIACDTQKVGEISAEYCTQCRGDLWPNSLQNACVSCKQATGQSLCEDCVADDTATGTKRTLCKKCASGNGLNPQKICVQCTSSDGCTSCSVDADGKSTCSVCNPIGYTLVSGSCTKCSSMDSNCLTCSAANVCTSCSDKFYPDGAKCTPCDKSCATCSSATVCLTCPTGFTLSLSKCVTTISNCKTYAADGLTCTACNSGYYPSDSKTCQAQKLENCKEYVDQQNKCQTCVSGYYLKAGETTCTQCVASCGVGNCTDASTCSTCIAGFYIDSTVTPNVCKPCSGISANCLECAVKDTCSKCKDNFYGATCKQCAVDNCATGKCSTDATTCSQCASGFGKKDDKCLPCTDTQCQTCTNDQAICTECKSGYWANKDSKCTSTTIVNCVKQTASDVCELCDTGFKVALGAKNLCVSCGNAIPGCSTCDWVAAYNDNALVCSACLTGYALVNQVCIPCPAGCGNCTLQIANSNKIVLADEGLVLADATNIFAPYTQAVKCIQCLPSFTPSNSDSAATYCAKSQSSYLIFALIQLILVAFLLF